MTQLPLFVETKPNQWIKNPIIQSVKIEEALDLPEINAMSLFTFLRADANKTYTKAQLSDLYKEGSLDFVLYKAVKLNWITPVWDTKTNKITYKDNVNVKI